VLQPLEEISLQICCSCSESKLADQLIVVNSEAHRLQHLWR
jgi:hypothetical protein